MVDEVLSVAKVTALHKVNGLLAPSSSCIVQLERPQEVGCGLEVLANGVDFVDQIFNANDAITTQMLLNHCVVGDWNSLTINLAIATLVHEIVNGLHVRIAPRNVRFSNTEHILCGLVDANKNTIVDLAQAKELKNLSGPWM